MGIACFCSIMALTRDGADWIRPGMEAASGMFFQYFLAIWPRMTVGLSRAGLKVDS